MRALFIGDAASFVALSPWLIPWIASAMKMTREEARNAPRSEFSRPRSGDKNKPEECPRNQAVMHERFRAKVEALIWPD